LEDEVAQLRSKMKSLRSSNNIPSIKKSTQDDGGYLIPEYNAYTKHEGLWQPIVHMGD
jgi:hypothetical protein